MKTALAINGVLQLGAAMVIAVTAMIFCTYFVIDLIGSISTKSFPFKREPEQFRAS